MDFFLTLLAYGSMNNISHSEVKAMHQNYCQNLYWQPDAKNKLREYGCDIESVSREILRVKLGRE